MSNSAKIIVICAFLFSVLLLLVGAVGVGVLIMVKGFGLSVVSWGWIIGGAFSQLLIAFLISILINLVDETI